MLLLQKEPLKISEFPLRNQSHKAMSTGRNKFFFVPKKKKKEIKNVD